MIKAKVSVDDKALDLVELSQVSVVKGLISEDAIDREELSGPEGDLIQF